MQFIQSAILVLIGAVLGSLLTYWGRIGFAKRTEYYRLRAILVSEFEGIIAKFGSKPPEHPATYIENVHIDTLVRNILAVMPCWKRNNFQAEWNDCRYDKEIPNMMPREYTQKSPDHAQRLRAYP
jgi:hypothetical protein